MINRCHKEGNHAAKYYYDKGITVCDEWRYSLDDFIEWAKSSGYELGLTIERIDNSKGYCPENCTWIPSNEQQKNRSVSRYMTYKGRTMIISDWARETGIHKTVIRYRLNMGMSPDQAINSAVNCVEGVIRTRCLILNMETGIYYDSIFAAAKSSGWLQRKTLSMYLDGKRKNKTNFVTIENYKGVSINGL